MNIAGSVAGAAGSAEVAGLIGTGLKDSSVNVSGGTPFAGVVQSIINQSRDLEKQADVAATNLMSGQGTEVHDVMIATQKATAAFELALQVRNKAVSAYQQMMGMQF